MSHLWTFSPSSEEQLKKCIAASLPPDENNKWYRQFGKKIELTEPKPNLSVSVHDMDIVEEQAQPVFEDNYNKLIDSIEKSPVLRYDILIEECSKNNNLFIYLAQQLSTPSIDKICKHLFSNTIPDNFLINFYTIFIPTIIKREHDKYKYLIDFFKKSKENYNNYIQLLLTILLTDSEVPRESLMDYVCTLNDKENEEFMKNILNIDLNEEAFANNLEILYRVYSNCAKTTEIQNLLLKGLIKNGEFCKNVQNYGRLLRAFLEIEKSNGRFIKDIKNIVDKHRSKFSRQCELLLNGIMAENVMSKNLE